MKVEVSALRTVWVEWSSENRVVLDNDKCKELRISFAKQEAEFDPIVVNDKALE